MTEVMTGMKLWFGVELAKLIEAAVFIVIGVLMYGAYYLYMVHKDRRN